MHHAALQPRAGGRFAPGAVVKCVEKVCPACGGAYSAKPSEAARRRYCSYACAAKNRPSPMKGKRHTPEARARLAAAPHAQLRGPDHPNWRGGYSRTERNRKMQRAEYRGWRLEVFERDDYTCQCCGRRGGELNAHHILGWAVAPRWRYLVANGSTLCEPCHRDAHARRSP